MLPVYGGLLATASVLMAPVLASPATRLPGDGGYPDTAQTFNYYWLTQVEGLLGLWSTRRVGWPLATNRIVRDGFPLDGWVASPFLDLLGWPAGFNLFLLLVMLAMGAAMAWFAACWWQSRAAGLVAGAVVQTSALVSMEAAEGRFTHLFGLPLLVLCWGAWLRGRERSSARWALVAGAMWGLCSLAYWYLGVFCALGLAVPVFLEGRSAGRERLRRGGALLLGCLLVAGVPLVFTLSAVSAQPGLDLHAWSPIVDGGRPSVLADLVETRSLDALWRHGSLFRPFTGGLVVFALFRHPLRRAAVPLAWLVTGALVAVGPWFVLPGGPALPGPFLAWLELPLLRRFWWPVRGLFLVAPALAILAGGVTSRLRKGALPTAVILAAACLLEAHLALPRVPWPTTPGAPTEAAQAVSRGTGPALVLPLPAGLLRRDALPLVDQVHHGRPLVNTYVAAGTRTAMPEEQQALWSRPPLSHLVACERDPGTAVPAGLGRELARMGIAHVYVDLEAVAVLDEGRRYLACLAAGLGEDAALQGPYRVYPLPLSAGG